MSELCSQCAFFIFDEEYDEYICDAIIDEDDFARITLSCFRQCPYYRNGDEYMVVRKQM